MREAGKAEAVRQRPEVKRQAEKIQRQGKSAVPAHQAASAGAAQRSKQAVAKNRQEVQQQLGAMRSRQTQAERRAQTTYGRAPKSAGEGPMKSAGLGGQSPTLADPDADRKDRRSDVEKRGGASLADPNADRKDRRSEEGRNGSGSLADGATAGNARKFGRDAEGEAMNQQERERVEALKKAGRELEQKEQRTPEEEDMLNRIRAEVEGVSDPGAQRREGEQERDQDQGQGQGQEPMREGDEAVRVRAQVNPEYKRDFSRAPIPGQDKRQQAGIRNREDEEAQGGDTMAATGREEYERDFSRAPIPGQEGREKPGIRTRESEEGQGAEERGVFTTDRFGNRKKLGEEGDVFQQDAFGNWKRVGQEGDVFQRGRSGWSAVEIGPSTRLQARTREEDLLASGRTAARRGRITRGVVIP